MCDRWDIGGLSTNLPPPDRRPDDLHLRRPPRRHRHHPPRLTMPSRRWSRTPTASSPSARARPVARRASSRPSAGISTSRCEGGVRRGDGPDVGHLAPGEGGGDRRDDRLGLVHELPPGEAQHRIPGELQVSVPRAVALQRGAARMEREAVDLDDDALVGSTRSRPRIGLTLVFRARRREPGGADQCEQPALGLGARERWLIASGVQMFELLLRQESADLCFLIARSRSREPTVDVRSWIVRRGVVTRTPAFREDWRSRVRWTQIPGAAAGVAAGDRHVDGVVEPAAGSPKVRPWNGG